MPAASYKPLLTDECDVVNVPPKSFRDVVGVRLRRYSLEFPNSPDQARQKVSGLCAAFVSPSHSQFGNNERLADALELDTEIEIVDGNVNRQIKDADVKAGEPTDTASFCETVSNITNALVGAGVMTVPYGFAAAGWAAALVLAAVLVLLSTTGLMLGSVLGNLEKDFETAGIPPSGRDFSALGFLAFGKAGKLLIGFIFVLELFTVCDAFLVMVGINMNLVFGISKSSAIICSGALMWLLVYAPMKFLAKLSVISVVAIACTVTGLVWSGAAANDSSELPDFWSFHTVMTPDGLTSALGLSLFCMAGHPLLPSMYWSMRDRSQFAPACICGFAIAAVFYGSAAAAGYYYYGEHIKPSCAENLGKDLKGVDMPGYAVLKMVALVGFVIKIQGVLPIVFGSLLVSIETSLPRYIQTSLLGKGILRSCVAALMILVALFFEDALNVVCGFCGCALIMLTSVIFPSAVYLRVVRDGRLVTRMLYVGILLFGIVFAVKGTYDAVVAAIAPHTKAPQD
eukprot:TRINITY_DN63186_c0_g1_i1.p1 TRINITY_DN63186_c0_g1~~TRINITY_DN63186_c0_g1_i1.p1  ORF type:complete len:526 (-),score=82.31 TRINITY_DN63186_c0_g1_i1:46-1584(-)